MQNALFRYVCMCVLAKHTQTSSSVECTTLDPGMCTQFVQED